ncbi:PHP domain-containing protein, partial [Rickettsiales bacterium]|nr:PHP domain-containing protein [Rickettsiales bacterium]
MSKILKDNEFIHLRNHSSYSLCEGSIRIEELIEYAKNNKVPAISICDKHNMFGALEFSIKCKKDNIQPIISCQIRLDINEALNNGQHLSALDINKSLRQSILIAKNKKGYLNLLKLVSDSYINREVGLDPCIKLSDLSKNSEGLIFLCGNLNGVFGKL